MNESDVVRVSTGARLHFGLLCLNPDEDRQFGGAGMMVERPGWSLQFELLTREEANSATQQDVVHGPDGQRVQGLLRNVRARFASAPPPCRIHVESVIPAHQGLGSGTQLALCLAAGLAAMQRQVPEPAEIARLSGRGLRSGLGVHGFDSGGFLVDGGKGGDSEIAPLLCRHEIPQQWRVVLVMPRGAQGLSGEHELEAFRQLRSSQTQTSKLSRLILMQILPALIEADFDRFAEGIHDYGIQAGEMFAKLQGSSIADPEMRELYNELRSAGRSGIGQSSWGPGLWILCRNDEDATFVQNQIRGDGRWEPTDLQIARPRNHGAVIDTFRRVP